METRWGKRLGRYEVVAELGRGAMGVVYKARDPKIDRFVAIKTIALAANNSNEEPGFRDRFFQEAQAAGRMFHPGIVTIFDVGEEPETRDPYIVMEFIGGQSLELLLRAENRKLPLEKALRLTEELAEALDYAHAQGVVHRDIKPANILVTEDGHAKIADFGIAKLNLSNLTLPGEALGTPAYMSPEQLAGEPVDARSDLFSLGVIMYGMLTGYNPFQGNSAVTVCFKIANREPVRASALCPELPPEIDAVIGRAIAKDPADRYQRGVEFAMDLRELQKRFSGKSAPAATWANPNEGHESGSDADTKTASSTSSALHLAAGAGPRPLRADVNLPSVTRGVTPAGRRASVKLSIAIAIAMLGLGLLSWRRSIPTPETAAAPMLRVPGTPLTTVHTLTALPASKIAAEPAPKVIDKPDELKADELKADESKANRSKTAQAAVVVSASPKPSVKRAPRLLAAVAPVTAPPPAATSNLEIEIEHHFSAGDVHIWIDDNLIYSHTLHGEGKQHLVHFHTTKAYESGTAQVPIGKHQVRVQVESDADTYDQSQTISGTFDKTTPATLRITFEGRKKNMLLALQ